jgi:hypothetical protein
MSRSTLLAVTGLLWALFCGQASGAELLPRMEGPAAYAGELSLERESYRAELRLGADGNFILHEELLLPGGKVSGWEHAGLWHQIRDGAFVQLSNAAGLYRLLNVGGGGNLYLSMRFSNGEQHSAVLRRRTAEIHGSGISPALQERGIRSIPPEKKRASHDLAGVFLENAAGKRWKITRLGREAPPFAAVLRFIPGRGRHEGRVECFDGRNRLSGEYRLWNGELTLSVTGAAQPLDSLFSRARAWRLAGEVLELLDEKEPLALLEALR